VLSEADYNQDDDVLSSFMKDANYVEWKPIPPDSDTDALHQALCERAKERKADQLNPAK
jgi:hypothetical protein